MTFLVKKIKKDIKKIIFNFFKDNFDVKSAFLLIKGIKGNESNKNTIRYPEYLNVGKLKNQNKKIITIKK